MFLGKLHRVRVTHADPDYEGSVTIDEELMEAANICEYEQVHIWNVTRGTRLVTYALRGPRGSRTISINGAAAHRFSIGDRAIIATFADLDGDEVRNHKPSVVLCDENNEIIELGPERAGPQMPRYLGNVDASSAAM